jgi:integrase
VWGNPPAPHFCTNNSKPDWYSRKFSILFADMKNRKQMREKIATVPRLVEAKKGDWYVYFQAKNPLTGKMKPFKYYKGFKKCKNNPERREHGAKLVKELSAKLRAGWTPFDDQEMVIYNDNLEYEQMVSRFDTMKRSVRNNRYFLNDFLLGIEETLRPNTLKTYRSKLRIYCNWLDQKGYADMDVSAISTKIIKEFIRYQSVDRDLDRLTVEKYIQILKAYYTHLKKLGKVLNNPVNGIPLPPKKCDLGARPINHNDMKELLPAIKESDPQLYLACMFVYYLSLRPQQELRLLKIKDVDLYNNIVTIVDGHAKVKRRTVNIPVALRELCAEYLLSRYNRDYYVFGRRGVPGPEPTGKNTLRNRFNRVRDELGLPDTYKFYSLKHTGGGRLLENGVTIEEIRDHMGHRSIDTTSRYLRRHFGLRSRRIIEDFPPPV